MRSMFGASVRGSLRAAMTAEMRAISRGLRRGIELAGKDAQDMLRAQVRAANFNGGRALENAWRLKVYPSPGVATLRPAASIQSAAPNIHDAFDRGANITTRGRGRYLAIPTAFNTIGGRRKAGSRGGLRVTAAQMAQQPRGQSFLVPLDRKVRGGNALWCLRVAKASALGRNGRRSRRALLFAAGAVEVATGRGGGRRADGGVRKKRAEVVRELSERGFVPMFLLLRVVKLRKRLSIEDVERAAPGILARRLTETLSRD